MIERIYLIILLVMGATLHALDGWPLIIEVIVLLAAFWMFDWWRWWRARRSLRR
jgi:hypothetical protein